MFNKLFAPALLMLIAVLPACNSEALSTLFEPMPDITAPAGETSPVTTVDMEALTADVVAMLPEILAAQQESGEDVDLSEATKDAVKGAAEKQASERLEEDTSILGAITKAASGFMPTKTSEFALYYLALLLLGGRSRGHLGGFISALIPKPGDPNIRLLDAFNRIGAATGLKHTEDVKDSKDTSPVA